MQIVVFFVFKAESLSKESDPQHIWDWHDGRLWNTLCLSKYWGTSLEKHPAIKQPSKTSSIMLYRERLKNKAKQFGMGGGQNSCFRGNELLL